MVGARTLGDAVGDLLADDLVLIGRRPCNRGAPSDGLHRHLRLVEELQLLAALGAIVLRDARMGRDILRFSTASPGPGSLTQVQLLGSGSGAKRSLFWPKIWRRNHSIWCSRAAIFSACERDQGGEIRGAHRGIFGEGSMSRRMPRFACHSSYHDECIKCFIYRLLVDY